MRKSLRHSLLILAATTTPSFGQTVAPAAPATAPAAAPAPAAPPAQNFPKIAARMQLKDGDTVVFLGDSITHQCLYTQYVEDYFYTRLPKTRLHFHNAGVGGDRAQDALDRFDQDVAAMKPKYVTILLGMNDGSYTKYEQSIFDTYQKGMTTVLDRISGIGAQAILMTPTMYDSRANKKMNKPGSEVKEMYYNGVLSLYGSWLREQSLQRGLGFVDMWSPLNNLTLEQRRTKPDFTMIRDAVHPEAAGQMVMAAAVLNDAVPKTPVSNIAIALQGNKASQRVRGGTLGDLQAQGQSVSFNFTAEALPWVLPPEAAEGYKLTAAGHRNSNEKLTVTGLAAGQYDLKIDAQTVGTFEAGALAKGIELQANPKTPQYQQALKVALLNKQKNDQAMRPLRDQWGQLKGQRRAVNKAEQEKAPNAAEVRAKMEEWKRGFETRVQELHAKVKGFEDQIYQANQPTAHKYELVPAAAPAPKTAAQ